MIPGQNGLAWELRARLLELEKVRKKSCVTRTTEVHQPNARTSDKRQSRSQALVRAPVNQDRLARDK